MIHTSPVVLPGTLEEAVSAVAARPDAVVVAGGTDVMPRVNAGRLLPSALVCLSSVAELRGVWPNEREVVLGAGVTFAELAGRQITALVPALGQAARTVGTPQVRSQATLGGNLASGAPDADALPVLVALGADVVCRSPRGWRQVPALDLFDRTGEPQLGPGELIASVRVPVTGGIQGFMKIGLRGGPSRAAVSLGLAIDPARKTVTCAIGNVGSVAQRVDHAGLWLAQHVDWELGAIPDPRSYETFARLVADGVTAITTAPTPAHGAWWVDADYRRRAVEVCARRALVRALPPSGWLEQVRQYQAKAEFQRYAKAVLRDGEAPSALVPPVERAATP
jgi:CO/xanthine dehydrogenase FAD-binding subunit